MAFLIPFPSSVRCAFTTVVCAISLVVSAQAKEREFTDIEGRTITASVIKVSSDSCVLLVKNKKFEVPLKNLSDKDQEFLKNWIPEAPIGRPHLSVNFSDRVDRDEHEDTQIFNLDVTVENQDPRERFSGGTLVLMTIARHAHDRGVYVVGSRETKPIPVIGKLDQMVVPSLRYECKYSTGDRERGWRYQGYVALLYDGKNNIVAKSLSPGLDDYEKLLEAPVHTILDARFREMREREAKDIDKNGMPKAISD